MQCMVQAGTAHDSMPEDVAANCLTQLEQS